MVKPALDDATVSQARRHVAPRPAPHGRLHVVHPPGAVRTFEVRGPQDFGRAELADATVSRAHLRIEWNGPSDTWLIRDLDSRNGTVVEGQPVDDAVDLPHGAVVRAGDVLAVFERVPPGLVDGAGVDPEALPGQSVAMVRLRGLVARAAADPAPALVIGPTGSGKELVAAELHRLSRRRGPFVPFNCAALSRELAESQLFGHVRGAFTGAAQESTGVFGAAAGGTLFLDEIGELPLDLQPKLLRTLQSGEVQPVGRPRPVTVDVRVVAATHQPLAARVEAGSFRRDLLARLALWEVPVPALADRRADVLAWRERLHRRWCATRGRTVPLRPLDFEAAERLLRAPWPENLRGLDRLVHAFAEGDAPITAEALDPWLPSAETQEQPERGSARRPAPDRETFVAAFEAHGGSVRATAQYFGRDRRQIYRWMETFGLK